jgi:hypothetical protein
VQVRGKWGYINTNGQYVISPQFESARPFCAGIAEVSTYTILPREEGSGRDRFRGKKGFIDKTGRYVWRNSTDYEWLSHSID